MVRLANPIAGQHPALRTTILPGLLDTLRRDWGFKGYVMSDCWAIVDIWKNHKIVQTPEQAAALAVKKGTSLANVEFLATKGAVLKEMTLGEGGAFYVEQALHGRPYYSTRVGIAPGETATIVLKIDEPTSAHGDAEVPIQPLVDDPTVTVDVPACGPEN